ncbi:MAG TPA: N-acetylmuramoyl-L-alanine amidase, partial [Saprospiraceae bacterium]|nr:N-acetylmuramoyl-L-alanine amidase [Saprospiraceae bacterium]
MGVCMLGNLSTVAPSEPALQTLRKVLFWKSCDSNIDPISENIHSGTSIQNISGHRDGCATECPG